MVALDKLVLRARGRPTSDRQERPVEVNLNAYIQDIAHLRVSLRVALESSFDAKGGRPGFCVNVG